MIDVVLSRRMDMRPRFSTQISLARTTSFDEPLPAKKSLVQAVTLCPSHLENCRAEFGAVPRGC